MRPQKDAFAISQVFFNPDNRNSWIVYCASYDTKENDWDYILILAQDSTPKLLKVKGSKLIDKVKRRKLELR